MTTLREKIKGILTCRTLDKLRNLSIEDVDEDVRKYRDELGFLKHALFLFHAKQLKQTGTIPSQYLSEIIWQYLSHNTGDSHEDQTVIDRIQERRKVFTEALKSQLEVLNKSLNSGIIPAYYLYYWTELDETRNSNFSTTISREISGFSIKSVVQHINELEYPTKKIIVFPHKGSDVNAESYDEYVANLNSSLYERSEYYDLIMLDSIQVSQYSSRGGIHTFQNLLMNYSSEYENRILWSDARIFDIVRSENGLIEALPVTRNFHLPARGQTFNERKSQGISPSIIDFFKDGCLEHLIEEELVENNSINTQKRTYISNFYKKYTSDKCFTEFTSESPKELQFALDMDKSFFIPMQLARGNHATYTLMAYTANIQPNENFVLTLLSRQPTDQIDRVITALQERLEKIFRLIFLYVPTGALCLDHLRAGKLREGYPDYWREGCPDYWFDPCLPIEAVGFHGSDFQIVVRPEPATLRNLPLSCLGGFCLGVTRSSRDASRAAQAAIDIAQTLVETGNRNPQQIRQNSESLLDLSKRDWLVHEIDETPKSLRIDTPQQATCRPNTSLWPLLEAKISFTFRLYVAALFAFRAIHFECIPLLDIDFEGMHQSDFSTTYALRGINQDKFEEYCPLGFEISYLNKLTPSLIENYFENMMNFLLDKFPVESSNSEETKEFIRLNLNDIIGDADYICGILQACAEYAADTYAENPGRYHIDEENDEAAKARVLYRRASLFMRSMAASMSKTIKKEIIS